MNLRFTEALLVAEWVLGPFDIENDLRNEGDKKGTFRDQRLEEAEVIRRAANASTLSETADILREVVDANEWVLDRMAGVIRACARRIAAARPSFYLQDELMDQVLEMESAARRDD